MWNKAIASTLFILFNAAAIAGPNDPLISMAWVGESVPGQTTATLQLNVTTTKAVTLLSASSPAAGAIEIQNVMLNKGALKMHVIKALPLPDHRTTLFGARGLFLMMTGLKQPLTLGEQIPLNLTFEFPDKQVKTIAANVEVKPMELSYKHYGPNEVYDHR